MSNVDFVQVALPSLRLPYWEDLCALITDDGVGRATGGEMAAAQLEPV